jgi:Cu(I)/Ag(I) efflux system membrane fusion protein
MIKRVLVPIIVVLVGGFTLILAHSQEFKPEFVSSVVKPYLKMQVALAGDDLAMAREGAKRFIDAMGAAPGSADARQHVEALLRAAKGVAQAPSLSAARTSFRSLSSDVISLVQHVGAGDSQTLFLVHCPMAFEGQGGDWLQSNKTVANPYHGSAMLRCGTVKKQVAGVMTGEGLSKDSHAGHNH